jgi:hypothetical protein
MAVIPFFKERPCSVQQRLAKVTFLAMLPDGSRQKEFYLSIPDDRWEILSFDPKTRDVCVRHTTLYGGENLSSTTLGHLAPTNQEEADFSQGNETEIPTTATELLFFANESNPQSINTVINRPTDTFRGQTLPAF